MDIARLSNIGYTAPNYPVSSRSRERVLELVTETDAVRPARDTVERVVYGEVLQRQRSAYSSTRDYLDSRVFDAAYASDESATDAQSRSSAGQSDYAVGAYLSHTRELIQPDVNRGKRVDYFI
ncbi:MAG: hypothetical protein HY941_09030 [Gammaproteobacteria bacterium]|nr:hypothetical protein [Gammaproteobacteria bacterium]